jgi:hypothetical protein
LKARSSACAMRCSRRARRSPTLYGIGRFSSLPQAGKCRRIRDLDGRSPRLRGLRRGPRVVCVPVPGMRFVRESRPWPHPLPAYAASPCHPVKFRTQGVLKNTFPSPLAGSVVPRPGTPKHSAEIRDTAEGRLARPVVPPIRRVPRQHASWCAVPDVCG